MSTKYALKKSDIKLVISEEVAVDQIIELLSYYDIDVERLSEGETEDEIRAARGLEKSLDHVRDAFRAGILELKRAEDGKLTVTQRLTGGEELTYGEISARNKLAMEKFDSDAGYSRIYAFMGSLSGVGKAGIEKLPPKDLGLVEVLGAVFSNA